MRRQACIFLAVFLCVFCLCLVSVEANPLLPSNGLQAEMAGEWEKAIEIYENILKEQPDKIDLWIRIADIEAHLGDYQKVAASLEEAARLAPDDAEIHYRLAQAHSMTDQPNLAFPAIERAVELDPANIEYLRAHAQIANWVDKSELAAESYEQILLMTPDDDESLLNLARSYSWSGQLDRAVATYDKYLQKYPGSNEICIDYAKTEAWRGNYAVSLDILENCREEFGKSREYVQEKARVLAWANRPTEAMELIVPLLEENPDDYEVNYSHTLALHYANQPSEAVDSLDKLRALRPDSRDTFDINRFVMTPLRPSVTLGGFIYADDDDIDHYNGYVIAACSPKPETRYELGAATDYLDSEDGTGFEPFDDDEHAWHHKAWIGIRHRFSPEVAADGYIGVADAEGKTRPTYGIGLDYRPKDNFNIRLERDYSFYLISPRALDLGIRRGKNYFEANWEPNLLYTVILGLGYDTFTDDNDRWEAVVFPRRAFMRTEKFNLDVGVRGWWYGFDDQLDNGYYDPSLYQSYMVSSLGYWKISDDDGVSITLDMGAVKDDDMSGFEFGWGTSVEGVFGLYRDVMFKIGGSFYHNVRQNDDDFEAYVAHAAITFRF